MSDVFRSIRSTCYGRDELSGWLQERYDRVADGEPGFVVLLGSTGLGKTRLVQELYRWLAENRDPPSESCPQGYWPDAFVAENEKDSVNPVFDKQAIATIPFLWWGLRFKEQQPSWTTISESLHCLGVHSIGVAEHQIKLECDRAAWFQLFGLAVTAAGLIPGVGTISSFLGLAKEAFDAQQRLKDRVISDSSDMSSEAVSERLIAERVDEIIRTLALFLDDDRSDSSSVPVVLFLDDAQWMDSIATNMIRRIWSAATDRRWKLLIVATHWDDEWQRHASKESSSDSPRKLAQFVEQIRTKDKTLIETLQITGVPNNALETWIIAVLPGLEPEQRELLLTKARAIGDNASSQAASGSPRVMEEIFKWLLATPRRFFVDRDPNNALLRSAMDEIREEVHDLRDIVKRRYLALSDDVREALGWSSLQGVRFLNEISLAAASKVDFAPPLENLEKGVQEAEHPCCWIARVSDSGSQASRFNLCEFRANVFCEVVQSNLDIPRHEVDAIEAEIKNTLAEWLQAGRFNCPVAPAGNINGQLAIPEGDFTIPERRDALRMAISRFRPQATTSHDDVDWRSYGLALARLVELDAAGPRWGEPVFWEQAEQTAIEFASARPNGWPIEEVSVDLQIAVSDVLRETMEYPLSVRVLRNLKAQCENAVKSGEMLDVIHFANVIERLAAAVKGLGLREESLDLSQDCLEWRQLALEEFGHSPNALRNVMVALKNLTDIAEQLGIASVNIGGSQQDVLQCRLETLTLGHRIREETGDTFQSLRDLAFLLKDSAYTMEKKGLAEVEFQGDTIRVLNLYQESLSLERINLERHGRSFDMLRDISVSLYSIADAMLDQGIAELEVDNEPQSRLDLYLESHGLCNEILDEEGRSPLAIGHVCSSSNRIADAMRDSGTTELEINGQKTSIIELRLKSLVLRREMLREFGSSKESLRGIWIALNTTADSMDDYEIAELEIDGEQKTAMSLYLEALEIAKMIVNEYGRHPLELTDLSQSYANSAKMMQSLNLPEIEIEGESKRVVDLYIESLKLRQEVDARFDTSPLNLRWIAINLEEIAKGIRELGLQNIELDGESKTTLQLYNESLVIRRRMITEFGRTRSSLSDLGNCLGYMAELMCSESILKVDDAQMLENQAIEMCIESLTMHRKILEEFGRSPKHLESLSRALDRAGEIISSLKIASLEEGGREKQAIQFFYESFASRLEVLDSGSSPRAMRNFFVSLEKLSHEMCARGITELNVGATEPLRALDLSKSGLIESQLALERNRTCDSLQCYCTFLERTSDVLRMQELEAVELKEVSVSRIDLLTESLSLREQIVQEYGRTQSTLRGLFLIYSRMATAAKKAGNSEESARYVTQCEQLLDEMDALFPSAQVLQDRAWLHDFQADSMS